MLIYMKLWSATLCSFIWNHQDCICTFETCNSYLNMYEILNMKESCIAFHSSRSIRPCELTICLVDVVCNQAVKYLYSVVVGCVLQVCDLLSRVLQRVAVELVIYIYLLCFISTGLFMRLQAWVWSNFRGNSVHLFCKFVVITLLTLWGLGTLQLYP